METGATLSKCGLYRYELYRIWDNKKPLVLFIMLNPSTADADKDDATIRRCIGFAKSWGYGGIMVGNLFAFRATDPNELLKCENPIGHCNSSSIISMSRKCIAIVCAWGNSSIVRKLGITFDVHLLRSKLYYLKLSIDETPMHPLYLPKTLQPVAYEN